MTVLTVLTAFFYAIGRRGPESLLLMQDRWRQHNRAREIMPGWGPGEARKGQARPEGGQGSPGKARRGQKGKGKARKGQERPGEARGGQKRPGEAREGRERPGEARRGSGEVGKGKENARKGKKRECAAIWMPGTTTTYIYYNPECYTMTTQKSMEIHNATPPLCKPPLSKDPKGR